MDGLVLICGQDGRLLAHCVAGRGIAELKLRQGMPFPALFASLGGPPSGTGWSGPDPVTRALDMLSALRGGGAVLDRPVATAPDGLSTLYISGRREGGELLLAVTRAPGSLGPLVETLSAEQPELAGRLRPLADSPGPGPALGTEALFEEMSRLNNDLATSQRALAAANRDLAVSNEQKNRLMGMLAHDLRSPLQAVSGFAALLESRLSGRMDEDEAACLERIRESSLLMRHMIEDVLSMAAVEAGRLRLFPRPTDIAALVRRNVAANRILAQGKGMTILPEIAEDLPVLQADPAKLEQVLNNLLSNAVKFSPQGSAIRLSVRRDGAGEEAPVRIDVADSGRGMAGEELDLLFHPFTRAGTIGTGGEATVGLGLYICRTIVEGHGGRIELNSKPGRGTVVTVLLPAGPAGDASRDGQGAILAP
ncbi:HAMP domain-containing sensor histidine kinase [Azospirillum sp. SYSU D00513]|uniref:sensor histidine kinase n=1 Tax=Azospirillum sp. SYSU D00513 TaxID=2812561 RepID=UPI001A95A0C0|nr:HAMP domain-containing sensor histidine kinase [Azospirillum sp. SYSU D00513]